MSVVPEAGDAVPACLPAQACPPHPRQPGCSEPQHTCCADIVGHRGWRRRLSRDLGGRAGLEACAAVSTAEAAGERAGGGGGGGSGGVRLAGGEPTTAAEPAPAVRVWL